MINNNEIRTIIYQLQKHKSENNQQLSRYGEGMMNTCLRLSSVRFAMNYIVLCEMLLDASGEGKQLPAVVYCTANALSDCVNMWIRREESNKLTDAVVKEKEASTKVMQQLTNLADRYSICEYVLNRKEYQFHEGRLPSGYSDDRFVNELLRYVLGSGVGEKGETKQQMQMLRTVSVVEQLPIRMTKMKFSQLLHDGLTVYETSDRETLDNLLEMIRTTAGLSDIQDSEEMFPFLCEILDELEQDGLEHLNRKRFDTMNSRMQEGFGILNDSITFMMLLQELINDLYVMSLCRELSEGNEDELLKTTEKMIGTVWGILEECRKQAAFDSAERMLEPVYALSEKLEGQQEELYETFTLCDSVLEELSEAYKESIDKSPALKEQYGILSKLSKLLSGSLYAKLDSTKSERTVCDSIYIEECFDKLIKELFARFSEISKSMKKAVMAKILAQLPPFLRTYNQLEAYIRSSLSGCDDISEKLACVEILEGMMRDE